MYQTYCSVKQNACLICFKRIDQQEFLLSFIANPSICLNCLSQFKILFEKGNLHGYPVLYLYEYNEFFKTLLFRYKGQYDIALADIFLSAYRMHLKKIYRHHIVAITPSATEQNEQRGFVPMEKIAESLDLPLFTGLYKKFFYKQSDQTFHNRSFIKNVIGIKNCAQIKNQDVLIIDDVLTSGYTMLACANCVKQAGAKSISFLILSKRSTMQTLSSEKTF